MFLKRLGRALLFPHVAVLLLLLPVSGALLIYAMLLLAESDPVRIGSYVLAFYTLTVWCARVPRMMRFVQAVKRENKYVRIWLEDPRLRMNVTVSGSVLWNGAYGAFQLVLGIYHKSPWFYSMAAYYCSLAVMRFFLVRYTLRYRPGEKILQELKQYRACGWAFLVLNIALSGVMLYMVRENRTLRHHQITTIAMAAYTFAAMTIAIVNVIKYRRYNSPVMSASRAVSLAAACTSMFTLENTMLATFSSADMPQQAKGLILKLSGGAISVFIIVMALYMILEGSRKMKYIDAE